jgi:hypothetical protein
MRILTYDQLECLASPVRNEVFSTFLVLGPSSTADAAKEMDCSPERLHYHVRHLVKVGLLVKAGSRQSGKREEAIYQTVDSLFRLPDESDNSALTEMRLKAIGAGLRRSFRQFEKSARAKGPAVLTLRQTVKLKPEDSQAFWEMIEQAAAFARERSCDEGVQVGWTTLFWERSTEEGE